MKKEKMVTRTFTRTHFEMTSVNATTCEVIVTDEIMDASFKTAAELLKHCRSIYNDENNLIIKCTITFTENILIGLSESDFLKYGTVLPPRPISHQNKGERTNEVSL